MPITTLREGTAGAVRGTRRYSDLMEPYGLCDEMRMLFRARDGRCWGGSMIARGRGPEFDEDEVARLGAVLADIGDGLRTMLFRDAVRDPGLLHDGPALAIVGLTVERAQPPQIASIMASAHGLTPRETEVFLHVLAGQSRDEMARSLFISPWKVQDHLKSIFTKTGVSSRRALVAKVVHGEYVPRFGTPVGPDGFFLPATREGSVIAGPS